MAEITISVEESSDGTYVILKDLTPIEEYIGNGIDINTDIVSVTYTIEDSDTNTYNLDVTSDFLTSIRDVNGLVITTDELTYTSTFFADGIYTSTLDIIEDSTGSNVTQTGESDDIFVSQIVQVVISQTINADWKTEFNPHTEYLTSDLRKRYYLLSIEYSAQSGFLDNAEANRLALNKLCSYAG